MKHLLNWSTFFQQDIQASFVMNVANYHNLLDMPFAQGLEVIVSSVPALSRQEWITLHVQLTEHRSQHKYIDYLLHVGELIQDYIEDMQNLLNYNYIEYATSQIQSLLMQKTEVEQIALMACLRYFAQSSMQARMMFQYLLQNCDMHEQQMQIVQNFYGDLTERQKDVAALMSYGLTNQEIAHTLYIEPSVVAEHLTGIFSKFQDAIPYSLDKHGSRYRLIHWLTRLFIHNPYLLSERKV